MYYLCLQNELNKAGIERLFPNTQFPLSVDLIDKQRLPPDLSEIRFYCCVFVQHWRNNPFRRSVWKCRDNIKGIADHQLLTNWIVNLEFYFVFWISQDVAHSILIKLIHFECVNGEMLLILHSACKTRCS